MRNNRRIAAALLAAAAMLPIGVINAAPAGAATGLSCTKLSRVGDVDTAGAEDGGRSLEHRAQGDAVRLHGHAEDRQRCDRASGHQERAAPELHHPGDQAADAHPNRRVDHSGPRRRRSRRWGRSPSRPCPKAVATYKATGQGHQGPVREQDADHDRDLHTQRAGCPLKSATLALKKGTKATIK